MTPSPETEIPETAQTIQVQWSRGAPRVGSLDSDTNYGTWAQYGPCAVCGKTLTDVTKKIGIIVLGPRPENHDAYYDDKVVTCEALVAHWRCLGGHPA